MSETVLIPYGENGSKVAQDLLAAAEDLDLDPVHTVKNQPDDGGFRVPEEVAMKAGYGEPDEKPKAEKKAEAPKAKPAAKKTAAKKTAAKKTAAKK